MALLNPCRYLSLAVACQVASPSPSPITPRSDFGTFEPYVAGPVSEVVAEDEKVENEQDLSQAQQQQQTMVISTSGGVRLKVKNQIAIVDTLEKNLGEESKSIQEGAAEQQITLPSLVVHSAHFTAIKKGLCFKKRDINKEEVRCHCHPDNHYKFPTITLTPNAAPTESNPAIHQNGVSAAPGNSRLSLSMPIELGPADYLGEPYLDANYQILCPSRLRSLLSTSQVDYSVSFDPTTYDQVTHEAVVKSKRVKHYLTQAYVPEKATPEENLKSQCIFIGIICFFLITTYIILVFKRRKRMQHTVEKQEDEQEEAAEDKEAETEEQETIRLQRAKTSFMRKATAVHNRERSSFKSFVSMGSRHNRTNSQASASSSGSQKKKKSSKATEPLGEVQAEPYSMENYKSEPKRPKDDLTTSLIASEDQSDTRSQGAAQQEHLDNFGIQQE